MSDANDWNRKIIDEFRANGGKVGGPFEGAPMLLLHHTGAKTGAERVSPLMYQPVGDDLAIFASYGGAPRHPAWYRNVMASGNATVELGTDTVAVRAREAVGDERQRIWEKQKRDYPGFAEYEEKTRGIREIPVVVLERV